MQALPSELTSPNWVTPIIAGLFSFAVSYVVAAYKVRADLDTLRVQNELKREDAIQGARERYVHQLRIAASSLNKQLAAVEGKLSDDTYGEVRNWLQIVKNHADGHQRRDDFRIWCYYEGVFALSTLYYTCSYLKCSRD